jgi:DNA-binding MarR family transcriptional regulator
MNPSIAPHVFDSLHTLIHLYRSHMHQAMQQLSLDLSHMECKTLMFFAHHPGATLSELAAHSMRDKGQLTRVIHQLIARQLLAEHKDPDDKRRTMLQLTPQGEQLFAQLQTVNQTIRQQAMAGMSDADGKMLVALIQTLVDNLSISPKD